jgi:hypothetical protein
MFVGKYSGDLAADNYHEALLAGVIVHSFYV